MGCGFSDGSPAMVIGVVFDGSFNKALERKVGGRERKWRRGGWNESQDLVVEFKKEREVESISFIGSILIDE